MDKLEEGTVNNRLKQMFDNKEITHQTYQEFHNLFKKMDKKMDYELLKHDLPHCKKQKW